MATNHQEKINKVLNQELETPLKWLYLSFADETGFKGAVIIQAHGVVDASIKSKTLGINPGGEVLCIDVSGDYITQVPETHRNKLLTREQLAEIGSHRRLNEEHLLKISPQHFEAVNAGLKTAELRKNDRGFMVGDVLNLREWDNGQYTSNGCLREITHLADVDNLAPGYVLLSMKPVFDKKDSSQPPVSCDCPDSEGNLCRSCESGYYAAEAQFAINKVEEVNHLLEIQNLIANKLNLDGDQ